MRVTIAHSKSKEQIKQAVDRAMQDAFQGLAIAPLKIVDAKKSWDESTMTFSMTAQMGLLRNPISGMVEVTDRDVIIDADLGLLNNFVTQEQVRAALEPRILGLLT
jgi:hypothetical protein